MTPELFGGGLPFSDYMASMQTNREILRRKLLECLLPAGEQASWAEVQAYVLVVTEDWCQDSVTSLPPLIALTQVAPGLEVRVFRREANLSLARALLKAEYPPIPAFLCYDREFDELGRYVEKPAGWRALQADPEEMAWLRADPALYDATWWELELAELATILKRKTIHDS